MGPLGLVVSALVLSTWSVLVFAAQPAVRGSNKAGSAATPAQLLSRAADASRTTDFKGVLVYRGSGAMEVLSVVHRYEKGVQSEHLVTLTGTPRELIRQGDRVICILPRDEHFQLRQPQVKSLFARLDPQALSRISRWYQLEELPPARVAGRECLGVAVNPRDDYRYGYQVWLDKLTGVPLRVVLVGRNGEPLEQMMFTQVSFPKHIPDSAFRSRIAPADGYHVVHQTVPARHASASAERAAQKSGPVLWQFGALPPGFQVTVHDRRRQPGGSFVDHVMLSDGLSSVSVFSTRLQPGDKDLEGLSHIGAVHAYGRTLDGYHVTVVGEAPQRTVRAVGDAIEPLASSSVTAPAMAATVPAIAAP
ncbi:MAG TPA: MucB/RseB C-terminal domain-containing protein [Nevskiaceae bacterium]|nr:MucB/RseB C-terminal domain-containing protein [Nevskiaceae bacterium]